MRSKSTVQVHNQEVGHNKAKLSLVDELLESDSASSVPKGSYSGDDSGDENAIDASDSRSRGSQSDHSDGSDSMSEGRNRTKRRQGRSAREGDDIMIDLSEEDDQDGSDVDSDRRRA